MGGLGGVGLDGVGEGGGFGAEAGLFEGGLVVGGAVGDQEDGGFGELQGLALVGLGDAGGDPFVPDE